MVRTPTLDCKVWAVFTKIKRIVRQESARRGTILRRDKLCTVRLDKRIEQEIENEL